MPPMQVLKCEILMPDQSTFDVLGGRAVTVYPISNSSRSVDYMSEELPLKFKKGAKISLETHCSVGGRTMVIRREFVGRKGGETLPKFMAYP